MFSDYSVTSINMYSPSGKRSPKNQAALVLRKQSFNAEDKRKAIANLTDDEIVLTSIDYAQKKTDKTVAGKLEKALPSLFVTIVPIVFGALQKGSLSDKTKTALVTAGVFGGTLALFDKYDKGVDRIENASEKIEKSRKEHPVAARILDFTAKAALLFGASAAVVKGSKFLQNKFKPSVDKINKSISKASEKMDKSLLGRGVEKLNTKNAEFLLKHPKISKVFSDNSFLPGALTFLGWLGFQGAVQCKALDTTCKYADEMASSLLVQREAARDNI